MSYEIIKFGELLGDGTYGKVFRVLCHSIVTNPDGTISREEVTLALKCCRYDDALDGLATGKELDLLKKMRNRPFISGFIRVVDKSEIEHLYPHPKDGPEALDGCHILLREARMDLSSYAEEIHKTKPINALFQLVSVIHQIVMAIEYLHLYGIIHKDVKTNNILVFYKDNDNYVQTELTDFGLSEFMSLQDDPNFVVMAYIYRAIEIIMKIPYGMKIDMWALGCVFFEILFGTLFLSLTDKDFVDIMRPNITDDITVVKAVLSTISPQPPKTMALLKEKMGMDFSYVRQKESYESMIYKTFSKEQIEYAGHYKITVQKIVYALDKLLTINPVDRPTSSQFLEFDLFDNFRPRHNSIISMYPLTNTYITDSKLMIVNCNERKYGINLLLQLYNAMRYDEQVRQWFSSRVMFHTLNHFDKFLYEKFQKRGFVLQPNGDLFEDGSTIPVVLMSLLYMNVKYFKGMIIGVRYTDVLTKIDRNLCVNFEFLRQSVKFEIDYLKHICYDFYHPTVLEMADHYEHGRINDKLNASQLSILLTVYTRMEPLLSFVTTHAEMFRYVCETVYKQVSPLDFIEGEQFLRSGIMLDRVMMK